jgi:nucleotide-binding universal stress UspA family protein
VAKEPVVNIQHILVPLDFSADAEQALDAAMELAKQFQARLTLIHVIQLPVVTEVDLSGYYADIESSARQEMENYQKRVAAAGLAADVLLESGAPFRQIVDAAKTRQADLIVMGTHGRTGMQHLLIGSVAERVVRLAPCPVMVMRHDQSRAAA